MITFYIESACTPNGVYAYGITVTDGEQIVHTETHRLTKTYHNANTADMMALWKVCVYYKQYYDGRDAHIICSNFYLYMVYGSKPYSLPPKDKLLRCIANIIPPNVPIVVTTVDTYYEMSIKTHLMAIESLGLTPEDENIYIHRDSYVSIDDQVIGYRHVADYVYADISCKMVYPSYTDTAYKDLIDRAFRMMTQNNDMEYGSASYRYIQTRLTYVQEEIHSLIF